MLKFKTIQDNIELVKETSHRTNKVNSLKIGNQSNKDFILIDANYPFAEIDELHNNLGKVKKTLLFSHFHPDHTAHAFYHEANYDVEIYLPVQEADFLTDIDKLMDAVGISELNIQESYNTLRKEYMKFHECKSVKTYIPGKDKFNIGNVLIKSLHIPGHSPGQTAFQINNEKYQNKILYVADIGAHPYYGDFISDLQEYKKSIDFLEEIYLSDNFILIPAHGTIYKERDEEFFKRIRERITKNRKRIIKSLSKNEAKSIKELVEDGIMTPKDKQFEPIKGMYYLWDGGTIYQHLKELEEENRVLRIQGKDFLSQKFKLL